MGMLNNTSVQPLVIRFTFNMFQMLTSLLVQVLQCICKASTQPVFITKTSLQPPVPHAKTVTTYFMEAVSLVFPLPLINFHFSK